MRSFINGQLIDLILIEESDAAFILSLRGDSQLNQFISNTEIDINKQKQWIQSYKERESKSQEFYYIVRNKITNSSCGTVRIYDIDKTQATWGSFILHPSRPNNSSYEVMYLSLKEAFEKLKLEKILLDVRKDNSKAIYLYEKFGFKFLSEDMIDRYYMITKSDFEKLK